MTEGLPAVWVPRESPEISRLTFFNWGATGSFDSE